MPHRRDSRAEGRRVQHHVRALRPVRRNQCVYIATAPRPRSLTAVQRALWIAPLTIVMRCVWQPPKDGTMGDCPLDGTLPWNQGCIQRCNPDFIVANTSHHPYCTCGASGGPRLSARSVVCEPCSTCADWGIFIFVLMVGGPACCGYTVYYFQLLPRRLRRKLRKATPKRCKNKPVKPTGP